MNYATRMKLTSDEFLRLLQAEREKADWRRLLDQYAPIMARLSV